jgi:NADH-quinone oxidoreductase subunit B
MPEPKWCIAMGACASSGGCIAAMRCCRESTGSFRWDVLYFRLPAAPEALIEGLMRLQRKIDGRKSLSAQKPEISAALAS